MWFFINFGTHLLFPVDMSIPSVFEHTYCSLSICQYCQFWNTLIVPCRYVNTVSFGTHLLFPVDMSIPSDLKHTYCSLSMSIPSVLKYTYCSLSICQYRQFYPHQFYKSDTLNYYLCFIFYHNYSPMGLVCRGYTNNPSTQYIRLPTCCPGFHPDVTGRCTQSKCLPLSISFIYSVSTYMIELITTSNQDTRVNVRVVVFIATFNNISVIL